MAFKCERPEILSGLFFGPPATAGGTDKMVHPAGLEPAAF